MTGRIERLTVIARAARHAGAQAARERWPRERREALQRERLTALVAHAREHSPYYRDALAGYDPRVGAASLPVFDKATMMERFDDVVCDRRLRRDALLAHVETLQGDELYLGRYRATTTSGSSGRKGLFVFDRAGWAWIVGLFLYFSDVAGTRPRLPRRRVAVIGGASPAHMSRRGAHTLDVGLHRMLSLPVTLPMPALVEALNRFEPDYLNVYPSMGVLLAEEQLAGRLRLKLRTMSTSSELRTPEMTTRITEAFGVQPFDLYATTEGLWACDCEHHEGLHLMEDGVIAENVDADGHPVPEGEPGARLLVTNLANRVQPLIRLAVADAVTLTSEPCACGRTLRRIERVDGRSDDVVWLPGADGRSIAVHPMQFAVVARDRDVVEFQVVQEGTRMAVLVVVRGAAPGLEARVRDGLDERLGALGVRGVTIDVERRETLERSAGGKLQIVTAERRTAATARLSGAARPSQGSSALFVSRAR
jgi:phenylacetate-coenzyme A ligase PaaK-like adenylate-forming protein